MPRVETITKDNVKDLFNYNPETGELKWKIQPNRNTPAGSLIRSISVDGYYNISYKCRKYRCSRVIWLYVYGKWPNKFIDHINGIRTDNRLTNLRDVECSENNQNQQIHREGKHPGISKNECGKFEARKYIDGDELWIGTFKTFKHAKEAWGKVKDMNSFLEVKEKSKAPYVGPSSRNGGKTFPCTIEIKNKPFHLGCYPTKEKQREVYLYALNKKKELLGSGIDVKDIKKDHLLESKQS